MRSSNPFCLFAGLATLIVAGVAAASPAAAQALFRPATTADESAVAAMSDSGALPAQTVRQRLVRIDPNVLSRHVAPAGADRQANRASRANALDGVIVLNLFSDTTATFRRSDVSANDDGGYIWEGEVAGQPFHEALLIVRNGQVTGRVQLGNRIFEIKRAGNGLQRIIELDPAKFPPGGEPLVPPHALQPNSAPTESTEPEPSAKAATKATANLLVAYTAGAKKEAGSVSAIQDEITQAIALSNQAYKRAKVPLTLKLVGTVQVNYNEGGSDGSDYNKNLNDITTGNALKSVRTKRDQLKADLVSLFRKGPPNCTNCSFVCGLAWIGGSGSGIMGNVTSADAPYAYSVVGHGCAVNLAFTHELGHNMGMQHDRFIYTHPNNPNGAPTVPNPAKSIYNFGYTDLNHKIYTIMAYYVECQLKKGAGCVGVNWFSSPTIKASPGNVTIGIASGKANAADNSTRLLKTYQAVSKYR